MSLPRRWRPRTRRRPPRGGRGQGSLWGGGQLRGAVGIGLQGQRVTGAVQTVSHQLAGNTLSVKAVDDLIHGLVLVDGDGQIGGVAVGLFCAGLLVVVIDGDLGVTDGDLDGTGLGAALIAVVANHADLLDQRGPQLKVYQIGIADLCFMCHTNFLSFLS